MFDPEGRRYIMKPEAWNLLINFQGQSVGIYIMLLNNSLDHGMVIIGAALTIGCFLGLIDATYDLSTVSEFRSTLLTFLFGVISYILFLNI
jgi:hypothetical protein